MFSKKRAGSKSRPVKKEYKSETYKKVSKKSSKRTSSKRTSSKRTSKKTIKVKKPSKKNNLIDKYLNSGNVLDI